MKVLALVTDAYGAYGGIAQYNRDLLEAWAQAVEVEHIDVLPRIGDAAEYPQIDKLTLHPPRFGRLGYALKAFSLCLSRRPDVIFCGHLYHGQLAATLARLTGARLVCQLHGTEVWSPLAQRRLRPLERADLVLCVSEDTKARFLEQSSGQRNAKVLHNTVSPDYRPADRTLARQKFGLADEYAILTVGRLDARKGGYKGHERIIRALPGLRSPDAPLTYLIAGMGDDQARLENIVHEVGVEGQVRFLGKVPYEDLPDLYRAADLFVLPSTGEGFGIVFLEAMASGTPALGLRVGGAPDALADGELGACVSEENFPAALQQAVLADRPDPVALHSAVESRFGRKIFRARAISLLLGGQA